MTRRFATKYLTKEILVADKKTSSKSKQKANYALVDFIVLGALKRLQGGENYEYADDGSYTFIDRQGNACRNDAKNRPLERVSKKDRTKETWEYPTDALSFRDWKVSVRDGDHFAQPTRKQYREYVRKHNDNIERTETYKKVAANGIVKANKATRKDGGVEERLPNGFVRTTVPDRFLIQWRNGPRFSLHNGSVEVRTSGGLLVRDYDPNNPPGRASGSSHVSNDIVPVIERSPVFQAFDDFHKQQITGITVAPPTARIEWAHEDTYHANGERATHVDDDNTLHRYNDRGWEMSMTDTNGGTTTFTRDDGGFCYEEENAAHVLFLHNKETGRTTLVLPHEPTVTKDGQDRPLIATGFHGKERTEHNYDGGVHTETFYDRNDVKILVMKDGEDRFRLDENGTTHERPDDKTYVEKYLNGETKTTITNKDFVETIRTSPGVWTKETLYTNVGDRCFETKKRDDHGRLIVDTAEYVAKGRPPVMSGWSVEYRPDDQTKAKTTYENGVLVVTIVPFTEEERVLFAKSPEEPVEPSNKANLGERDLGSEVQGPTQSDLDDADREIMPTPRAPVLDDEEEKAPTNIGPVLSDDAQEELDRSSEEPEPDIGGFSI